MKMHRILAEAASNIAKSVFREHRVLDQELATAIHPSPPDLQMVDAAASTICKRNDGC
jgi:hypothetical protein